MTAHAIIVHDLSEARALLRAAAGLTREITLASPPGAGLSYGAPWFAQILAGAKSDDCGLRVTAILDCADAPGVALAALREGLNHLALRGIDPRAGRALQEIAQAHGGKIYKGRLRLIDPAKYSSPEAAVTAWLKSMAATTDETGPKDLR